MKKRAILLDQIGAMKAGDDRHPQVVMREFAHRNGVQITGAICTAAADTWLFEVEAHKLPSLPEFMQIRPHAEYERATAARRA